MGWALLGGGVQADIPSKDTAAKSPAPMEIEAGSER